MHDHRTFPTTSPLPEGQGEGRVASGSLRLGTEAGRAGLLALALALVLGACSTDFDPYAEGPPYFTLSADIDTREDTLFVRVQDLLVAPGADPAPLDARVTLEDLSTGTVVALRDSLTRLDGGSIGHLFFTTERLSTGRTYILRAERTDDPTAVSTVEIQFPPALVLPRGSDPATTSRRLGFAGTLVPTEPILITYDAFRSDTGASETLEIRYFPINVTQEVIVSLDEVADRLRFELGLDPGSQTVPIVLTDARARYLAFSISASPVENGIGSVVWTASFVADWRVPTEALEAVGLEDGQGG